MSIGLAGFSGVMIVLTRASGGFSPPERFRLIVLVYSSIGPMFLALVPFALLDIGLAEEVVWRILGLTAALYAFGGLVTFPPASFRLRKEYPDLFPAALVGTQLALHVVTLTLTLLVALGMTNYAQGIYTAALIVLLLHGAIAFVRLLFYRRHEFDD